jgi:hypothetical protein
MSEMQWLDNAMMERILPQVPWWEASEREHFKGLLRQYLSMIDQEDEEAAHAQTLGEDEEPGEGEELDEDGIRAPLRRIVAPIKQVIDGIEFCYAKLSCGHEDDGTLRQEADILRDFQSGYRIRCYKCQRGD